jgi:hypothetical protein
LVCQQFASLHRHIRFVNGRPVGAWAKKTDAPRGANGIQRRPQIPVGVNNENNVVEIANVPVGVSTVPPASHDKAGKYPA